MDGDSKGIERAHLRGDSCERCSDRNIRPVYSEPWSSLKRCLVYVLLLITSVKGAVEFPDSPFIFRISAATGLCHCQCACCPQYNPVLTILIKHVTGFYNVVIRCALCTTSAQVSDVLVSQEHLNAPLWKSFKKTILLELLCNFYWAERWLNVHCPGFPISSICLFHTDLRNEWKTAVALKVGHESKLIFSNAKSPQIVSKWAKSHKWFCFWKIWIIQHFPPSKQSRFLTATCSTH